MGWKPPNCHVFQLLFGRVNLLFFASRRPSRCKECEEAIPKSCLIQGASVEMFHREIAMAWYSSEDPGFHGGGILDIWVARLPVDSATLG